MHQYPSLTVKQPTTIVRYTCALLLFEAAVSLVGLTTVHAGILNLAWDAPTTNQDSSPLTDLSGYRVYSSTSTIASCPPTSSPQFVAAANPAPAPNTTVTYRLAGLTQGTTYFVRVTAVDTSGNESACTNEVIGVALVDPDSTPPTVSITAPAPSSTVSGTVSVTASATDNVGIASVAFHLDGVLQSTDLIAPYAWSWNTLATPNGSHTLTAVATDIAGNTTTSSGVLVNVSNAVPDITPPTVSLTAPANGATVTGSVTVSANATDNVAIANVQFYLDGSLQSTDTSSPYSWSWNTTTGSNGSHNLTAIATDTAGNSTTSSTVTVTVSNSAPDSTPPTVSLTAPSNGATVSGTLTVTATATDNVGVANVRFYLDGTQQQTDATSPYSWGWNTASAPNGSHTLTAEATDNSGNTATSTAISVTVSNAPDSTPPTVTITSPPNAATVSGTVTVAATATDNVGVASVRFYLDGVLQSTDTTNAYTWSWNSTSTSNGSHALTAVATDTAGNTTTSAPITVTVSNATQPSTAQPAASANSALGGSGCFIATAAYGSPMAGEVVVLRTFRDQALLHNAPGRLFVKTYYRLSPPFARFIAAHDTLRAFTRVMLWPLVRWTRLALDEPSLAGLSLVLVSGGFVAGVVLVRTRIRRRHDKEMRSNRGARA
jgi:hypothetical protein